MGASFGISYGQHTSATAPESILVDGGQTLNLRQGKYFIYFFDPECSHCNDAAKLMSTYKWKPDVQVIGVAWRQPQWDRAFMDDNKFVGKVSKGLDLAERIAAGKLLPPGLDPTRELPERPVVIRKATARGGQ